MRKDWKEEREEVKCLLEEDLSRQSTAGAKPGGGGMPTVFKEQEGQYDRSRVSEGRSSSGGNEITYDHGSMGWN